MPSKCFKSAEIKGSEASRVAESESTGNLVESVPGGSALAVDVSVIGVITKKIMTCFSPNLTFSKGFIWLQIAQPQLNEYYKKKIKEKELDVQGIIDEKKLWRDRRKREAEVMEQQETGVIQGTGGGKRTLRFQ